MQRFKVKNTKKVEKDKRVTIDAKHKSVIKDIDSNSNNINKLNKQIDKLRDKQAKYTIRDNEYHKIEDDIIDIKEQIKRLDYNKNEYFIDNGRTLYGYYKASNDRGINKKSHNNSDRRVGISDDNEMQHRHQDIKDMLSSKNKNNKKGIFMYFNMGSNNNNITSSNVNVSVSVGNRDDGYNVGGDDSDGNGNGKGENDGIIDLKKELENLSFDDQTTIIRSYMNRINPEKYEMSKTNSVEYNMSLCQDCNVEFILGEMQEYYVCPKCGQIKNTVLDSDIPSNVKTSEVSTFSYQRLHHFKDCLAQFQAKESTNIPQDIIDKIKAELTKYRITDYNRLTPKLLRKFLKKLKLSSYYEHIPHIIYRISGRPAPKIPAHVEERLLKMFLQAEEIFMELLSNNTLTRLGIKNRKNIMRYTFMFYKLFELEGMYEFLDYLILLKCRKKLYKQDQIWKEICMRAGWHFKPTDWARI